MVLSLMAYAPFFAIALLAQWSDRYRTARWMTYGLLLLFDALIGLVGLLALLFGRSQEMRRLFSQSLVYPGALSLRWDLFGLVVLGTAILAPMFLLSFVRRILARVIPIDAASGVHATALMLAVLAVGLNFSQLPLIGGLDALAESTAQVPFVDLLISNLPIGLFAFVGVGFLVRRTPHETWKRLGLKRVTWRHAGLAVGLTVGILVFYYGIDSIWQELAPKNYAMMEALGEVLYGGVMGTWQALVMSLAAGLTEELLFRGALQPRFGLWLTAVLFAGVHVQYGLTPAILEVLGAALVLGWLRRRTNTGVCIILHMLYDIAGLLVFPLLP